MLASYAKWYSFTPPHWPNFPPPLTPATPDPLDCIPDCSELALLYLGHQGPLLQPVQVRLLARGLVPYHPSQDFTQSTLSIPLEPLLNAAVGCSGEIRHIPNGFPLSQVPEGLQSGTPPGMHFF